MDAEHERVKAEDPLRTLFHEAGELNAPIGLEERILARLARPALTPTAALITPRMWFTIGAMTATMIVMLLLFAVPGRMDFAAPGPFHLPDLAALLTDRWSIATMAGIVSLLVLDRLVQGRVRNSYVV